jgi:multicomponent Na+:H+ antiporter subunit A
MIRGRSPVVRSAIRAASPLALLVAAFLFFAGHNQPGGGFAAGLVIGAVVALRTVAGIGRPQDATRWFAIGTALVSVVALAPLLGGEPLFDQVIISETVPLLGKVKSGSALVFDAGVTAIVVGLFVAVFDGLDADELGRDEVQV